MNIKFLKSILVFAAILALASCQKRTITVIGTGESSAQADVALINLSVITTNPSVEVASRENAERTSRVRADLISAGCDADKIVTDGYNIFQNVDYRNGQQVRGDYRVSNSMHIVVNDISNIGSTIDIAVKAGANEFSSIEFSAREIATASLEARERAMQNARRQAEVIAATEGAKVGKIISVDERQNAAPRTMSNNFSAYKAEAMDMATPVSPGKQKVAVTVVCVYEIR